MNSTIKNILAVVAGAVTGGMVNMAIIMSSGYIIPSPPGTNLTTDEGIKAAMPLLEPKHFILPFLAHALGTFVGAFIAALIAANYKMRFALGIGVFFLVGGIMEIMSLPSPIWFTIADLVVAYIPMAYVAGVLAMRKK